MAIPVVTPLPTAPSRSRPTTFSAEGDVFLGALENTFTPQLNAVVAAMNIDIATVVQKEASAVAAASNATAASASAASAANVQPFSSVTIYPINSAVISQVNFQTYRKITTANSSQDPANNPVDWVQLGLSPLGYVARTTAITLTKLDSNKIVDLGTLTGSSVQGFSSASALGAGWNCILKNTGTTDITLDPFGSELIDGRGSYVMYPGEARLIQCNGSTLTSVILQAFSKVYMSTGTFRVPPGYSLIEGEMWGGGGSGARSSAAGSNASGGGGGGYAHFRYLAGNFSAQSDLTVTVGAGGASPSTATSVGNSGGMSAMLGGTGDLADYFRGGVSAFGGSGGALGTTTNGGGSSLSGFSMYTGGVGGVTTVGTSASFSGGGGGVSTSNEASNGGQSSLGGYGGAGSLTGAAGNGIVPGGGGGGSRGISGAGARGEVRIWGVI